MRIVFFQNAIFQISIQWIQGLADFHGPKTIPAPFPSRTVIRGGLSHA